MAKSLAPGQLADWQMGSEGGKAVQPDELSATVSKFQASDPIDQQHLLQQMMASTDSEVLRKAAAAASASSSSAQKAFDAAFPGVSRKDRAQLYKTLLCVLAALALIGVILGAAALFNGKDSAAFFTFAGLALGGLTGILVPAPSGTAGG